MLSVFRHELLNPDIARRFHHKKCLLNDKGITKSSETMELDGLFPISSLKGGKSLIGVYGGNKPGKEVGHWKTIVVKGIFNETKTLLNMH